MKMMNDYFKTDKINVQKIDTDYIQAGNICMFASYSIIINYYSNNNLTYSDIYSKVIAQFSGFDEEIIKELSKTPTAQRIKRKEDLISERYHNHCQSNDDIRGFDYITDLHTSNALETRDYCIVGRNKAVKNGVILTDERLAVRDNLKKIGGLAMILYSVNPNWHSVVIGYDTTKNSYFKRDPNYKQIIYDDFLQANGICEYIWFLDK